MRLFLLPTGDAVEKVTLLSVPLAVEFVVPSKDFSPVPVLFVAAGLLQSLGIDGRADVGEEEQAEDVEEDLKLLLVPLLQLVMPEDVLEVVIVMPNLFFTLTGL